MKKFFVGCGKVYRKVENGLEWLGAVNEVGEALIALVGPVVLVLYSMYALQPLLSWVVTALFAVVGTLVALEQRRTAAMSIIGLVLYGMSWYVTRHYGIWPGMICWSAGVMTWFATFIYSAIGFIPKTPRMVTA